MLFITYVQKNINKLRLTTLRAVLNVPHGVRALGLAVFDVLLDLLDVKVAVNGSSLVSLESVLHNRSGLAGVRSKLLQLEIVVFDSYSDQRATTYISVGKTGRGNICSDLLPVDCVFAVCCV